MFEDFFWVEYFQVVLFVIELVVNLFERVVVFVLEVFGELVDLFVFGFCGV